MGTYLEDYLESIYTLPSEIKRNFDLIRELDKASVSLLDEMKGAQKKYLQESQEKIRNHCLQKNEAFEETTEEELRKLVEDDKLEELSKKRDSVVIKLDEKVAIAQQSYDLIDHHIRRLDVDLANYAALLKQNGEFEDEKFKKRRASVVNSSAATSVKKNISSSTTIGRKRSNAEISNSAPLQKLPAAILPPDDIDPNEPVYCSCRRISYGQMVGCDNDDCKYEWFHFDCVGISEQPVGKWYCKHCKSLLGIS